MTTTSPVDFIQISQFLKTIYAHKTQGRLSVVALPSKKHRQLMEEARSRGEEVYGIQYRQVHHQVDPEDSTSFVKFLEKYNGISNLYFRQGRMGSDTTGKTREDVIEVCHAWVDVDTRNFLDKYGTLEQANEACVTAMLRWKCPPTIIINSGSGIQAFWVLNSAVTTDLNFQRIETMNRFLSEIFNGDDVLGVQSCMRLPGTLNMNYEPPRPATLIHVEETHTYDLMALLGEGSKSPTLFGPDRRVVIPEGMAFEDMTVEQKAEVMRRAADTLAPGGGVKGEEYWQQMEANLSVEGERNKAVTAFAGKLIGEGYSIVEAASYIVKHGCTLPLNEVINTVKRIAAKHEKNSGEKVPQTKDERIAASSQGASAELEDPVEDAGESPAEKIKKKLERAENNDKRPSLSNLIDETAEAFIASFQAANSDLLYTDDTMYTFDPSRGIWTERKGLWLEQRVLEFIKTAFGIGPKQRLVTEIAGMVRIKTHIERVDWANVNVVLCADGQGYDIKNGKPTIVTPNMFLREENSVAANYNPVAKAPVWEQTLEDIFSHIDAADRPKVKNLIEEWMGSIIIGGRKPRAISRALIMHGESNTGKSTILDVTRMVIGESRCTSASVSDLTGTFAGMSLLGKSAWLADELPVGGKFADDFFKKLVTNEPVTINRKMKSHFEGRMNITVGFATNTLPRILDHTSATWGRILLVPCDTQFIGSKADPLLTDKLMAEVDGIFQRIITAARRLLARGHFDVPQVLMDQQTSAQAEENPIADFIADGFTKVPTGEVKVSDIVDAYRGYLVRNGFIEQASNPFTRAVFTQLQAQYRCTAGRNVKGDARTRNGIHFTDVGLAWLSEGRKSLGKSNTGDADLKQANTTRLSIHAAPAVVGNAE